MIQIIGKKTFVGKGDRRYFILYFGQRSENTEGLESGFEFVEQNVFQKAKINGKYEPVYGKNYSGKAFINDLELIQ